MDLLSTASCEQRPPWHLQQRGLVMLYIFQWRRCLAKALCGNLIWHRCNTMRFCPDLTGHLWPVACTPHESPLAGWLARPAHNAVSIATCTYTTTAASTTTTTSTTQFIPGTQKPHDQFLPLFWVFCWLTRGVHSPKGPDQTLPPKLPWDRRRNYSQCLGS